jgi:oxygen-dependent protoporphyrinogen oxidase
MHVGIVGGGISGLTLHHYLAQRGVESTVFEAGAEPGGVIDSRRIDGHVVENGPQRTRLSPPVASLVESLDIDDRVVEAREAPLYVYRDGALRQVPFSVREGLSTDLLTLRGKLRLLLEPLTGAPQGEETVEESLTRTVGPEVAEYVVGPLYGGIYGTHPDEMLVEHSLGRALENYGVDRSLLVAAARAKLGGSEAPPVVSFDEGLQALPRAIAAQHSEGVRLDTPVEMVREDGDQFELETPSGRTTVDQVVFTTPADVTAALLEDLAPATATPLERLNYNPLAIVHLAADPSIDASGFQVQYEEAFSTLGVTCNATLFDRGDLHTAFLGGAKNPGLVDQPPSAILEVAEREFAELTGAEAAALDVQRLPRGMPAYDTTWTALEAIDAPDGVHLCANYESRAGIPGRVGQAKRLAERLHETATVDA